MGPLRLSGKIAQIKASVACHSHIRFLNSFSIWLYIFFLNWDRIHASEKEKQQNPKSRVKFLVPFFVRLVVRCSLLHARMLRPNIILLVFPCWDLWSGAAHDLQHGLREETSEFFQHVWFLVWFLVGKRSLYCERRPCTEQCSNGNAALLAISLLGIGLLQLDKIVTGDVRHAIKHGNPDKYWWEQL